jgi:hypothetical protein
MQTLKFPSFDQVPELVAKVQTSEIVRADIQFLKAWSGFDDIDAKPA